VVNNKSMQLLEDNPLFELQKTVYSSKNYTRRNLHQSRLTWVVNAIKKYSINTSFTKALEYGPGSGIYLPILSNYFDMVIAADVEMAYLSGIQTSVKSFGNLQLEVDNIQDSHFLNESFDLVLCSEVLEHVSSPDKALNNLYRILAPGGIAIVTTPQRYSLMELFCKIAFLPGVINLVRFVYQESILESGHISLKTYAELNAMINQVGFEVIDHDKFGLYIPLVAEFGGTFGGRFIEFIGKSLHKTSLSWMLWTQAYVLRKPQ
jgi:2-polyprenyl-3-methyl-5-hydroxy-6-metoxy-1,4-benzoquinol methylase